MNSKFKKFIEIMKEEFFFDKTLENQVCIDKQGNPIPWYTYPAIEYLKQYNYSDKKVFEFGCGNSSRFWAKRAKSVVSVENSTEWFEKWKEEFVEKNIEIRLREIGADYYNAILEDDEFYDIIVVDGKNRDETAKTALKRLKKGGIIIFDDSDRVNASSVYKAAGEVLGKSDLLQVDFHGFCPMSIYTKATTIYFSRDFSFEKLANVTPMEGTGNIWKLPKEKRKEYF